MTTIKINTETCIGCGSCVAAHPKFFEMKEGKAVIKKQPKNDADKKEAEAAKELCPVQAISIS